MNNPLKSLKAVPMTEPASTVNWYEEAGDVVGEVKKTTMLDVLVSMQESQENGYVYLDNVDLDSLNITKEQFSGFCSALTRAGVYKPVDGFFGRLID